MLSFLVPPPPLPTYLILALPVFFGGFRASAQNLSCFSLTLGSVRSSFGSSSLLMFFRYLMILFSTMVQCASAVAIATLSLLL